MIKGINILGYINKQFGLGEAVRCNIRAIQSQNIPFIINDFKPEISKDIVSENTLEINLSNENPYAINLIQINTDNFESLLSNIDESYFAQKYNIGFWAWELENFPPYFQKYIELLDEIWVPSNFCLNAISMVSNKPVLKFMHSIHIETIKFNKSDFGIDEEKTVFLTICDYHSSIERKNPFATIKAFHKAFGKNNKNVTLVIKTSKSDKFLAEKALLLKEIGDDSSILIIEEILSREKLNGLISICDVFVSLHRSEGFGLTIAEAMFLSKPVIATNYSANIEFMNNDTSILIPYKLIPVSPKYLHAELKNVWADVDIDAASLAMSNLSKSPSLREDLGLKAKKHCQDQLSPFNIGEKIKNRLNYIYEVSIPSLKENKPNELFNLKLENTKLKDKVSSLRKIKAVEWKLSFKNFQNKLTGKNRKYNWED